MPKSSACSIQLINSIGYIFYLASGGIQSLRFIPFGVRQLSVQLKNSNRYIYIYNKQPSWIQDKQ